MGTKIEIERGDKDTERGDEIKKLPKKKKKTILQTQNTLYYIAKPNSLLKTKIKTQLTPLFSETQKSKPSPSPKIKIQNLDEKEVSDQRCHSHTMAIDSLDQFNLNPTTTTEENPKQTLDDDTTTTAVMPPDRLEEEEEEEEPTDEASDQPSVTTVDSDVKYG